MVVNEAMACGLPLVLADCVGAAGDLLEPGGNGELVRAGDPTAVAAALERLAASEELRLRYGRRSRELVLDWGYAPSVDAFVRLAQECTR